MILFSLFITFISSIISFQNVSFSKGDKMEFDELDNLTHFFFFNSDISGILSNSENSTRVTSKVFSVSDTDSLTLDSNVSGFYWVLNSTFCQSKIYELSTQQLLYLQAQYPKLEPENDDSCIFYNNKSPRGKLSFSIFGGKTTATIYSTSEDGELTEIGRCDDGTIHDVNIENPFFIKIGKLPDNAEFYIDLALDNATEDAECYSVPIMRYSKGYNGLDSYKFGQITMLCTDTESRQKGIYLIVVAFLVLVLVICVIVFLCFKDKIRNLSCCSKSNSAVAQEDNISVYVNLV